MKNESNLLTITVIVAKEKYTMIVMKASNGNIVCNGEICVAVMAMVIMTICIINSNVYLIVIWL